MASGRTHDRLILWTAPLVGLTTGYVTGGGHWPWLVMGSYVFSGLMFSGDLDIPSRQWRRWGWLRFLWIPYQKICKHRSFWSHGLLVGTLGRLLYVSVILGIPLICGWAWQGWQGKPWPWWQWLWDYGGRYRGELLAIGVGLELGAWNHSLADWISSRWKKWRS
ncbi:MAG: metal-binding protein [Gloeomargarita sp. GMQP_bins_120]